MIPFTELVYFSFSVLILIIVPGPTMFYLVSRSLAQGWTAGIISLLGVNVADVFYILLVILGISALLFTVPFLFMIIKILGAVYLLYLAFQTLKSKSQNADNKIITLQKDNPLKLFTVGLLTNILNPKVALFFTSIFSQFITPAHGKIWIQSSVLGFIFITISFLVNSFFILSASKFSNWMGKSKKWTIVQNYILVSVLTFLAVKILLTNLK